MKKFLITLSLIAITTLCSFALEKPRWVGQPIYVYIPQYGKLSVLMKNAFLAWEKKSRKLVRFKFVNSPNDANIEVEFVDFVSNCVSAHDVGCTETYTKYGQFSKVYVTIGTKEYQRSTDGRRYSRRIVSRNPNNIYGVMLHEAGHAIGLGHSKNSGSIMYPYDLKTMQYLTKEDMRLLYNKYH